MAPVILAPAVRTCRAQCATAATPQGRRWNSRLERFRVKVFTSWNDDGMRYCGDSVDSARHAGHALDQVKCEDVSNDPIDTDPSARPRDAPGFMRRHWVALLVTVIGLALMIALFAYLRHTQT